MVEATGLVTGKGAGAMALQVGVETGETVETGVGMGLKNGVVRPPVGLAVDLQNGVVRAPVGLVVDLYGLWTAVTACTLRSHGRQWSSEDVTTLPG